MSFNFHGIGTILYGERDFWPDGSFITTEWFVVAWVPIFPICSKRISYRHDNPYARFDARGGFWVYETLPVNGRQAMYVYLWFVFVFVPFIIAASSGKDPLKSVGPEDWPLLLCLALSAAALVCPYFLRRWVKRRNAERWRRQALGLHG